MWNKIAGDLAKSAGNVLIHNIGVECYANVMFFRGEGSMP